MVPNRLSGVSTTGDWLLFVSAGSVKTHINNVYRKLDAHSRTQALARPGSWI
ncbi:MAG: helix-turn-helix transcriptional regulator [Actinobacteria bacterium]|nr:helix-turn-helix transcriptional regulator [Actinomycetota bacterium]MCA1718941.1 helix-turn-helix transcriptional regulator [Actinomycetota bacterium]